MSLVVVGSVAFDDLETPSGIRENILGGSASYFSLSASHFRPVHIVAVVGEDFGPAQEQVFKDRPIDLSNMLHMPGRSFHWKGRYDNDLNEAKTLETHLNVFAGFHPVLPENCRNAPFLFLGNIDPLVQLDVVQQMVQRPQWIALDTMNFWINGSKNSLLRVLKEIDILLVNEAEARTLSGENNLVKAYRHIQTLGPRILVVKRGEYGVSLFTPQGYYLTPAFPLEEVIDPTGAGDTFAGGFLGALAASGNLDMTTLKHAVVTGTVMASFTVEAFGTERLQTLTSKQIQERIEIFSNMIRLTNH